MEQKREGSAYRDFRACAYRNKYEPALWFGGRLWTYGSLLERVEHAYNTFCQMGVEQGATVCLWLPNCPDLLCSFYALSRLGAVAALAHPKAAPVEIFRQMEQVRASYLITTPDRYEAYCTCRQPLAESMVSLCRPEQDMKGSAKKQYLEKAVSVEAAPEKGYFDQQMERNHYHANEAAFSDERQAAAILFAGSSFLQPRPIYYLPPELAAIKEEFFQKTPSAESVYVGLSFAYEGGFLASLSALCTGRQLLWGDEKPIELLKKYRPDLIIGEEALFWQLRQRSSEFRGSWKNLQGGIQMGRPISELAQKFTPLALEEMGGGKQFGAEPIELKNRRESLFYLGDYGVCVADVERAISCFEGIEKCRCIIENGGLKLQVKAVSEANIEQVRKLIAYCRREIGAANLPRKVEFI